jgi:hypothetical protein
VVLDGRRMRQSPGTIGDTPISISVSAYSSVPVLKAQKQIQEWQKHNENKVILSARVPRNHVRPATDINGVNSVINKTTIEVAVSKR